MRKARRIDRLVRVARIRVGYAWQRPCALHIEHVCVGVQRTVVVVVRQRSTLFTVRVGMHNSSQDSHTRAAEHPRRAYSVSTVYAHACVDRKARCKQRARERLKSRAQRRVHTQPAIDSSSSSSSVHDAARALQSQFEDLIVASWAVAGACTGLRVGYRRGARYD